VAFASHVKRVVVSISELYPYKGVDQTIVLTPTELALCLFAMQTMVAEGVDTDDIDDMQALIDYVLAVLMVGGLPVVQLPIGSISLIAKDTLIPSGWVECLGQTISRTVYAALFAAIGTAYGVGDGVTTFNTPNLQNRIPMGRSAARPYSTQLGSDTHTLTLAETPAHTHTAVVHNNLGTSAAFARGNAASAGGTGTTASQGGGGSHNNIQPSLVLCYMIYAGN